MKRRRASQSDPPFMNLSLDEMSARIAARDRQLARRNSILILAILGLCVVAALVGAFIYGHWFAETFGAIWRMGAAFGRLDWWHALTILFEYKLSFLILGILIGFVIFLFVTFQIVDWLFDTAWDWVSSLWN